MSVLLSLDNVTRVFVAASPVTALKSVDLRVENGEYIAITGPSGSGKSTLLNVLGLLDRPSSGVYTVRGKETGKLTDRDIDQLRGSVFGFVFQASHVLLGSTVAKNAELPLLIQYKPLSERLPLVVSVLDRVGLGKRIESTAATISGGERQRLAIARALVHSPSILLLDEPTGSLDSANTANILDLLGVLNADGVTIVVVTHDPVVAARASRVIEMRDGSIIRDSDAVPERTRLDQANALAPEVAEEGRSHRGGRFLDGLADALQGVMQRPLRAFVSILLVAFGIGGFVASYGIGTTASRQVDSTFDTAAGQEVRAALKAPSDVDGAPPPPFADDALDRISSLQGVRAAYTEMRLDARGAAVTRLDPAYGNGSFDGQVVGVRGDVLDAKNLEVTPSASAGMLGGERMSSSIVFVGINAAKKLGVSGPAPGVNVTIAGVPMTVAGLITASDDPADLNGLIISSDAVVDRLPVAFSENLVIRTDPGFVNPIADAVPLAIMPTNVDGVSVESTAELSTLRSGVTSQLRLMLSGVSVVLLLLAGLAVAGAMNTAVQARRQEIGLRRAIGMTKSAIIRLFVVEGVVTGGLGGIVGGVLGIGAVLVTSAVAGWTPVVEAETSGVAILLGIVVGALSALVPALRASRTDPAETLRS